MRTDALAAWVTLCLASSAAAGPYAPAAGQPGSSALAADSPAFVGWATGFASLVRGPLDIAHPEAGTATFGSGALALGPAGTDPTQVVSLGDGGQITLSFDHAITDGPGFDFAVFENGFADTFLELAFVEVSSNGTDFLRFPSVSLTQVATQSASFGALDPTNLYNLAGKYRGGFGTPFDLGQLAGADGAVDVTDIHFVRIVDAVGSIDEAFATHDSLGNPINEPYPTAFASGGFDLDAVGVLHAVPEPAPWVLLSIGLAALRLASTASRRRRLARPRPRV